MAEGIDSDYTWLKTHIPSAKGMESREQLADKVVNRLRERIADGRLPFTLGIFGGWGTGKTTFLAMLADRLEGDRRCRIVYFNSWKYAGFMEIVPALIYKILEHGVPGTVAGRAEAARRVILALGKKYSDQIGDWAHSKIGVDPVKLFRDLYDVAEAVESNLVRVRPEVVRAYYTQVDKAQDELRAAMGTVTAGEAPENAVIVLIDELDRCDPDEAFNVIKQMRVLFGMRDLPVAFVVGANPEPIGLAIKHRYGLESEAGDYEARRILEKFVDSYEDLSMNEALSVLVREMWCEEELPWIMCIDEANLLPQFMEDEVKNASAFDAITTAVPLFANLRVLHKSFEYVRENTQVNRHLLWAIWLLEIANQIDPRFRRELRLLTKPIQRSIEGAYDSLSRIEYVASGKASRAQINFETEKGQTLFSIFRSLLWEHAKAESGRLQKSEDAEDMERARALRKLLSEPLRMGVVVLMALVPLQGLPSFAELCATGGKHVLPDMREAVNEVIDQFGVTLAS